MKICERSQAFVQQDGDLVFDHTKLILRRGDEYSFTRTDQRLSASSTIDISQLEMTKIPTESVWPSMDLRFTPAPDPLPLDTFIKQQSLLYYDENCAAEPSCQILAELEACEILRTHPHPNIGQYLGCVSKDGRIRGLCFVKYPMTLSQRLKDTTPFDRALCLQGIESGMHHMHNLGLIHKDLNPSNIMMDGNVPVIIDFDSCKREGDELGFKAGTFGWALNGSVCAKRENDIYSFSKIRGILMEGERGKER